MLVLGWFVGVTVAQTVHWLIKGGHWYTGLDLAMTSLAVAMLLPLALRRFMVTRDDPGQR